MISHGERRISQKLSLWRTDDSMSMEWDRASQLSWSILIFGRIKPEFLNPRQLWIREDADDAVLKEGRRSWRFLARENQRRSPPLHSPGVRRCYVGRRCKGSPEHQSGTYFTGTSDLIMNTHRYIRLLDATKTRKDTDEVEDGQIELVRLFATLL